jgi:osmoprotectant transport system ATP-binding protein
MGRGAVELDQLTRRFEGVTAVDAVSMRIEDGESLVLLGGSGSGKTTTLKLINRLLEPTSGTVRIGGEDVASLSGPELRRRIGYAFQQVGLFPHMTVAENIGITPGLLGWEAETVRKRVDEMLEVIELAPAEYRSRMPTQLSGGQAQRIGVARALAAKPQLVLLDEPFGALDPLTRRHLQTWLQTVQRELGFSYVFVTHDVGEALLLGDRIGVMKDGELLQLATPSELVRAPADDYVRALIRSALEPAERAQALAQAQSD